MLHNWQAMTQIPQSKSLYMQFHKKKYILLNISAEKLYLFFQFYLYKVFAVALSSVHFLTNILHYRSWTIS